MRRLIAGCVCAAYFAVGAGCASLSLFGQSHEHIHYHGFDPEDAARIARRLEAIETELHRLNESNGRVVLPPIVTDEDPVP